MENWTVESLMEQLEARRNSGQIYQWTIQLKETDREESYFIRSKDKVALDQSRTVSESIVFVRLEVEKGEKLGSANRQFFTSAELIPQISGAIETAKLGEEKHWQLKQDVDTELKMYHRADPLIWEDVGAASRKLSEELISSIESTNESTKEGNFNSAELFVARQKRTLFLSNGARAEETSARTYAEVCFSATKEDNTVESEEFLITKFGASRDYYNFHEMCDLSAENAAASLDVARQESGNYAVIIDANSLCQLFGDVVSQFGAGAKYYGTPFIERGSELIPGFSGDNFKLFLDPEMNHTFGSSSFNAYGSPQSKLLLVDSNKVIQNTVDKKISDYLDLPVTTTQGAFVIEPAKSSPIAKLRKAHSKVLEILQFSALFSNSVDLTFASEIRLARLYDNETGEVKCIKGGSIAGKFQESFKEARWSEKMALANLDDMSGVQAYYGPSHALLTNIPVTA